MVGSLLEFVRLLLSSMIERGGAIRGVRRTNPA
jgi:hypothetical protein